MSRIHHASPRGRRLGDAFGVLAFVVGALALTTADAAPRGGEMADPAKKAGGSGAAYANPELGVRARGPAGWKMVADRGSVPTTWNRLVTFNDPETDAQATLSVRPRSAATLDDLLSSVRADWDKTNDRLRVNSMRKVEASALSKVAQVIVDGSFTRKAEKPPAAKDGVPPPPSSGTPYRVQAVYLLGPGYTYLLYAQCQETHWARLRAPLEMLRESIQFEEEVNTGPTGEGSYRSEADGFTCRYPKDYTVVTPQRSNHLIQFEGVSEAAPVLSIYGFKWEQDVAKDVERLVAHYEENKGGTASATSMEVAGQQGMLVKAKATLGGQDRIVLIAVVKRGDDLFRLRASMPVSAEASGTAVFQTWVGSFKLQRAP